MKPDKLISLLKGHKIYIQTHNFPDADAIASAYGLQSFLKYYNIDSIICYDGKIDNLNTRRMTEIFEIDILSKKEILDMSEKDYIVTVDCQKHNSNLTGLIGQEVACIDHHPTFIDYEYKYKDIRITGACASIIAKYFFDSNIPIEVNVATALSYGIKIDTCEFTRGVTDLDIEMFAKLFKIADKDKVTSLHNNIIEFKDLRAYKAAIENVEILDNIGFAYIPFNASDALIAMISDFILTLNIVDVAIIYSIREDGLKFSVRSEVKYVNAGLLIKNALTGYGNGGGHHSMAGGFITKENVQLFKNNINYEIKELFLHALKCV